MNGGVGPGIPGPTPPKQYFKFEWETLSPQKRVIMGIGINIFLIAAGAILAFAVDATLAGLDIKVVGVILMIAGAIGLILTLAVFAPRRRRTVTEYRTASDAAPIAGTSRVTTDDVPGSPLL